MHGGAREQAGERRRKSLRALGSLISADRGATRARSLPDAPARWSPSPMDLRDREPLERLVPPAWLGRCGEPPASTQSLVLPSLVTPRERRNLIATTDGCVTPMRCLTSGRPRSSLNPANNEGRRSLPRAAGRRHRPRTSVPAGALRRPSRGLDTDAEPSHTKASRVLPREGARASYGGSRPAWRPGAA